MSEFAMQRRVAKMILDQKPSTAAGVKLLFGELDKRYPKHGWKKCEKLAWGKLLDEWVEWLDALVKQHKPPRMQLLWFETPESLNGAMTSISGWKKIGRKDDAWGADEDRVWPINEEGNTLERGKFMMPLVDEAMEMGGWGDKCEDDSVQAAVHAVVYGVNLLLVLNGLPQSTLGKEQHEPLGVTCGWASGDCDVVGGWVEGKWGKFPKATLAKKPPSEEWATLDPVHYVKVGGDSNWRDAKTGENLLHNLNFPTLNEAKFLVESGVDPTATDNSGRTVLEAIGAVSVPVLRYLIHAGADPKRSEFADAIVRSGLCAPDHLDLLDEYGVEPLNVDPLLYLARRSFKSESEQKNTIIMIQRWVSRKYGVNGRSGTERPPLWMALWKHAGELSYARNQDRESLGRKRTWDYCYDDTALYFLEVGANPNAVWPNQGETLIPRGATPLMVQRYDDTRLIEALLKHGADPQARCTRGRTALDYAKDAAGHPKLIGNEAVAKCVAILEKVTKV